QLGANWKSTPAQLEALRTELARRHPEIDPSAIRLSSGASSVQRVTLALGDGTGSFEPLQSSSSSGFPPYSAIFNVQLNKDQKERAAAALNGRSGFLQVTYLVTVPSLVSAAATITGDVQKDLASLDANATLEDCRVRIQEALISGRLKMQVDAQGSVSDDLRQ